MYIIKDIKACVIGGDERQLYAAMEMYKNNIDVSVIGIECENTKLNILQTLDIEVIRNANAIILPLPFSTDGIRVYSPMSKTDVKLDELIELLTPEQIISGGKLSDTFIKKVRDKNIRVYDYYTSERLTIQNALATAEGAVCIAMNELKTTLCGSKCAVLGYGRIGKLLAKMLKNFGADVSVFARSESALTWAQTEGYNSVCISNLKNFVSDRNVIFNTIPSLIITDTVIDKIDKNTIIIDMASYPGGVDFDYAKKKDIKVIFALSIPGKYAPITAGKVIADTVVSFIKEEFL